MIITIIFQALSSISLIIIYHSAQLCELNYADERQFMLCSIFHLFVEILDVLHPILICARCSDSESVVYFIFYIPSAT